jgi:plastocyanin
MKIILSALLLSAVAVYAVDVTGSITFKGTVPAEKEITPIKEDPNCAPLYPGALPTTHFYVVGKNGELADVVVSLKDEAGNEITGKSTGATATPAAIDQKGALYSPQILAVQTGQKLLVKNSDPLFHNIHTLPTVNQSVNQGQMAGAPDLTFTFEKPEMFLKFQCDVHTWMFAWVSVFDNPYFAVSGTDGKFTIKNVPAGKYTIEANHRKFGVQTAKIEVKADGSVTQDFSFEKK